MSITLRLFLLCALLASGCARFGGRDEHFPLLLALHGTGGSAGEYIEIWRAEAQRRKIILLVPAIRRAYENKSEDLKAFYQLVERALRRHAVDKKRIYIAGASSGSLVARWLIESRPSFWRAAVLVASPADERWARETDLGGLPPLLFVHGEKDEQFPIESIRRQVAILKNRGFDAELLSYPDAGHEQRPEWSRRILTWLEKHGTGD